MRLDQAPVRCRRRHGRPSPIVESIEAEREADDVIARPSTRANRSADRGRGPGPWADRLSGCHQQPGSWFSGITAP